MRPVLAALLAAAIHTVPGGAAHADDTMAPPSDLAARLATIADRSTCRITTRGRRTGKPHSVPIWFVVEGTTVYLGTLNAKRDWVRNLEKTPEVTLDVAGIRLRGDASTVRDATADAHIRDLLARKYWMAWIGSWFGKGPERTFRVDGVRVEST